MDCNFKIEIVKEIEETETEIKEWDSRGYERNTQMTKYVKANRKLELENEILLYVTPDDKFFISSDDCASYISVRTMEDPEIYESFGHEGPDTKIICGLQEELLPIIMKTKKFIRSDRIPVHLMKVPENTEFRKKHRIELEEKLVLVEDVEIDEEESGFSDAFFTHIKQFENTSEVHGVMTIDPDRHSLYFCIIFQKTKDKITKDNFGDYVTFCAKIENVWYYKGKSTINEEKCIDNRIFNVKTRHLNGFQEIPPSDSYKKSKNTGDSDDDDIIDLPGNFFLFYVSVTDKFCIIHDRRDYYLHLMSDKQQIDIFGPIKEKIGKDIVSNKFLYEKVSEDKIEIFGKLTSYMEKYSLYFKITLLNL